MRTPRQRLRATQVARNAMNRPTLVLDDEADDAMYVAPAAEPAPIAHPVITSHYPTWWRVLRGVKAADGIEIARYELLAECRHEDDAVAVARREAFRARVVDGRSGRMAYDNWRPWKTAADEGE